MGDIVFTNNASALLAGSITAGDTALSVEAGKGALFPNPAAGEYFHATLVNASGDYEIVKVTGRSSDTFTIERAQEGTTAQSWTLNVTRVELRLTAAVIEEMVQKNGDTMAGDLDMDSNELQNAELTGTTKITGGQTVGTKIRGAVDDASNEIDVPSDGTRATASGSKIVTLGDNLLTLMPIGSIIMWFGTLASLPSGWQICDGSGGTPDLRGSFPRGAGGSVALASTGGSATASGSTGSAGSHNHGGNTGNHALTVAEMPAHAHGVRGSAVGGVATPLSGGGSDGFSGHSGAGPYSFQTQDAGGNDLVQEKGSGDAHNHSISSDGAHTHSLGSIATIPPYVGVYFIMKVS